MYRCFIRSRHADLYSRVWTCQDDWFADLGRHVSGTRISLKMELTMQIFTSW